MPNLLMALVESYPTVLYFNISRLIVNEFKNALISRPCDMN